MLGAGLAIAFTLQLAPNANEATVQTIALPSVGQVRLTLTRFETLVSDARATFGGTGPASDSAELLTVARSVATFGGEVEGHPGSRAYMAFSPLGRVGLVEVDGKRFALAPVDGSWHGPIFGPGQWVETTGSGAPLLDEVCRVLHDHEDEGGIAGIPLPPPNVHGSRVRVAADCDYEFTSIFPDSASAAAYVVSLYGAISEIYRHECGVRVQISYLRLWTTPDDPYQDPDPLGQFRNLWNDQQTTVVRDVAQLLTGRRNLPYGGVAWLNAACTANGYSVCGFLIGSFADAGRTDPGNWDIIVTAHELGHNVGTLHTHDYDIDGCAFGEVLRGGIMSYCHTVSGATSNVDLTFHRIVREHIAEYLSQAECITQDCDGDGLDDVEAIALNVVQDSNADGIPDNCQDCDNDGVLDPQEIASGAADLDANGIPDQCDPDCNGNGIVDAVDISTGRSDDVWGNGVPDECERDCNSNGTSDYTEILANMTLDIDRNGELDACQDCDGDGTLDSVVLANARHWWVASNSDGNLRELNARSGVKQRASAPAAAAVVDLIMGPDGLLYGTTGDSVVRWNPVTGALVGTFVAPGAGALSQARGLLFQPDGTLLVSSFGTGRLLRYSSTGVFIGVFVDLAGRKPHGLTHRSDGVIAVSTNDGRVHGFHNNGSSAGTLADLTLLSPNSNPSGVLYLPNGDLLVASRGLDQIHRFDGTTGMHLGRFDVGPGPNSTASLKTPMSMKLLADGKVVMVTAQTGVSALIGFDAVTGYHCRTYRVYAADAPAATGLVVMPNSPLDCNGNLIPDSCDVSSGSSPDANEDGTPDECQGGPWQPTDLNFDGIVDGADLGILLSAWGPCASKGPRCNADVNSDGVVDGADLGVLLGTWD